MLYKNSDYTSEKTHYVSAAENERLMLFGEIIAAYCENHVKDMNTLSWHTAQLWYVKTGGTYSKHWTLKD
jgi:hypothetical protein